MQNAAICSSCPWLCKMKKWKKRLCGKAVILQPKSRHKAVLCKGRAVVMGVWFVAQSFSVLKYSLTPWHLNQINSVNPSEHGVYGCGGSWKRARIQCLASELLIQREEERQNINPSVAWVLSGADMVSALCLGTGPSQQLCAVIAAYGQTRGILPSQILLARWQPAWAGPARLRVHLEPALRMYPAGPPSSTATSPQLCLWLEGEKKNFCGRRALQRESTAQNVGNGGCPKCFLLWSLVSLLLGTHSERQLRQLLWSQLTVLPLTQIPTRDRGTGMAIPHRTQHHSTYLFLWTGTLNPDTELSSAS